MMIRLLLLLLSVAGVIGFPRASEAQPLHNKSTLPVVPLVEPEPQPEPTEPGVTARSRLSSNRGQEQAGGNAAGQRRFTGKAAPSIDASAAKAAVSGVRPNIARTMEPDGSVVWLCTRCHAKLGTGPKAPTGKACPKCTLGRHEVIVEKSPGDPIPFIIGSVKLVFLVMAILIATLTGGWTMFQISIPYWTRVPAKKRRFKFEPPR